MVENLPTPICLEKLDEMLVNYDQAKKQFLINGFKEGFYLGYKGQANCNIKVPNLLSTENHEEAVAVYLDKEINKGRIAGPFMEIPFKHFQLNPIGVVEKSVAGSFRIITNLSYPKGSSINDNIPREFSQVSYSSIQDAAKLLLECGKNSYLAKCDIESAFRLIPLSPKQYHLLVYKWNNSFYHDKCLPMGASSSCKIFECFSSALEHIAKHNGIETMLHYLDDFLIVNPSEMGCQDDLNQFVNMCQAINVPLAKNKTVGPTQTITFLGLEIDTKAEIIRLPKEKIKKCEELLSHLLSIPKCTKRKLESVLGLLSFTCQVVLPGRAFLLHMYAALVNIRKPWYFIRLSHEIKSDLNVWLLFLKEHNGISFYRDQLFLSDNSIHIFSDAAKSEGFGAYLDNHWFAGGWPSDWWSQQTIVLLEFIPIFLAIQVWGAKLQNKYIILHSDNEPLVHNINHQTSKEKLVRVLLRKLVLEMLTHNIMFQAVHVPGYVNVIADKLSRLQISSFKQLHPLADPLPTPIPSLPVLTL